MRLISIIIMLGASAALIAYDVVVAVNDEKGDTYSEIIRDMSYKHPSIPFVIAFICAHWFWNGQRVEGNWAWFLGAAILGILCFMEYKLNYSNPLLVFIIGFLLGHLAWAQHAAP